MSVVNLRMQKAKVIALGTAVAVAYGIVHDQITVRSVHRILLAGPSAAVSRFLADSAGVVLGDCRDVGCGFDSRLFVGPSVAIIGPAPNGDTKPAGSIARGDRGDGGGSDCRRLHWVQPFSARGAFLAESFAQRVGRDVVAHATRPLHGRLVCARGKLSVRSPWRGRLDFADLAQTRAAAIASACSADGVGNSAVALPAGRSRHHLVVAVVAIGEVNPGAALFRFGGVRWEYAPMAGKRREIRRFRRRTQILIKECSETKSAESAISAPSCRRTSGLKSAGCHAPRLCVGMRTRLTCEDMPTQSRGAWHPPSFPRPDPRNAARAGALAFRPFADKWVTRALEIDVDRRGHPPSQFLLPTRNFAGRNSRTVSRWAVVPAPRREGRSHFSFFCRFTLIRPPTVRTILLTTNEIRYSTSL